MPLRDADVPDGGQERSPFAEPEMRARLDTFLATYATADAALVYEHAAEITAVVQRLFESTRRLRDHRRW
jgi:hypothetical protein